MMVYTLRCRFLGVLLVLTNINTIITLKANSMPITNMLYGIGMYSYVNDTKIQNIKTITTILQANIHFLAVLFQSVFSNSSSILLSYLKGSKVTKVC